MTTTRIPLRGELIQVRVYGELWVDARITHADPSGGIDCEDAEGGTWAVSIDQRGEAWRFLEDERPELLRLQTNVPATCSNCGHVGCLRVDLSRALVDLATPPTPETPDVS